MKSNADDFIDAIVDNLKFVKYLLRNGRACSKETI